MFYTLLLVGFRYCKIFVSQILLHVPNTCFSLLLLSSFAKAEACSTEKPGSEWQIDLVFEAGQSGFRMYAPNH